MTPVRTDAFDWRWTAVSVAGTNHERAGRACEDASLVGRVGRTGLGAAVADGAGSVPHARLGAEVTVQALVGALQRDGERYAAAALWREAMTGTADAARAGLEARAAEQACALRDLSATGMLAWAWDDGLAGLQVGDGAIVYGLADQPGRLRTLTAPQRGEYANETVFLTSPTWRDHMQIEIVHGAIDRFAIVSDGLQMVSMTLASGEPHAPFFERLFAFLREEPDDVSRRAQVETLLRSERICERTADDKTLVVAVRLHPGDPGF